jgi:RimJ/RimL family protein N-acetyltransferase
MVTLGELTAAHGAAMLRWMRDPEVSKNLGLRSAPSEEKTAVWLERAATDPTIAARAILVDDEHVGNIVLDQIDVLVSKARLSIYVGEAAARSRGVGKAAIRLALELAFGSLGLHKVWLTVHARNVAAIAAYKAIGFVVEGTHRDEFLLDGERLPELYMGILSTDPR